MPNYVNVLQFYLLKKEQHKQDLNSSGIITSVAKQIMAAWKSANVDTLSLKSVTSKIANFIDNLKQIQKSPTHKRSTEIVIDKVNKFFKKSEEFFDIALCKCTVTESCKSNCESPIVVKKFLQCQRTIRNLSIEKA